jgi:hypothetical protein
MTQQLFEPYAGLISKAIRKADTPEEHQAAVFMIDHLENDYTYMHLPGKDERIQDLREQLQAKHDEIKRETQNQRA